tara:strand:- start:163 stop:807 length:645 start_codon:yes stop_codon:yes gene_type:complete
MKNTKTIKPLTPTMRLKGVTAFTSGAAAGVAKDVFFKVIASRVSLEQVDLYLPEFKGIAIQHYAEAHELGDRLIEELASPTLKNAAKMKGCKLTMKALKDGIDTMARRWIKTYKQYLKTGEIAKAGGKAGAKKKRATGGKTKAQTDAIAKLAAAAKAKEDAALAANPVKRAIEQVSSIRRQVLVNTLPSQCSEGLRQEIEIAAMQLVELLSKIK